MSTQDLNSSGLNGTNNSAGSSSNNASSATEATVIDAKKLFRLIFGYKWMFIFIIIASIVGMYFYTDSIIPKYQGEGTMVILQGQETYVNTGNDINSMLTSSFGVGQGSTIASELSLLQSNKFTGVIADKIIASPHDPDGQLIPILWNKYPEDSTKVSRGVLTDRIQKKLILERDENLDENLVFLKFKSPSPYEAATVTNLILDSYTQFSSDQNREQVRSALAYLNQEMSDVHSTLNNKEEMLRDFMHKEKLVEIDSQTGEIISALSTLENERHAVEIQKVGVLSSIENLQKELDNIKPGFAEKYSQGLSTKLIRFQYKLAELETEKMLMLQKNPELKENPEQEHSFQELTREINYLRAEITQMAEDFIGNDNYSLSFLGSPDGDLAGRVTELTLQLLALEVDAQLYQAQTDVLDERIAKYQETFNRLPDNIIDYAQITRDIETNEQLYRTISNQVGELKVWEQTQASNGRIIDYSAIPDVPVEPNKQLMLIWSLLIGFILSFAMVYIREMSSTRINSIEKLNQKKLTLLSIIPDTTSQKKKLFGKKKYITTGDYSISTDLMTILDPLSYASEAYRRMLSNIMFSHTDRSIRSILVTSPNKSEGKSSTIANLAAVFAETGKKVVVLDCDFRHPSQQKLWGLTEDKGIVDVLVKKVKLDRVIQPTVVDNIHVITTGTIPHNPAEVVQSENLKNMISTLKETYDIVLIDSPPFGFITDAGPLMQYVDGVILVTRFNQSKEAELNQCLGNLKNVNANVLGLTMMSFNYKKANGYELETYQFRNALKNYNNYNHTTPKKVTKKRS
ncbi:MAG: polysaccharide biosynthesis tyrosine autokinase [Balneolales bacterium]